MLTTQESYVEHIMNLSEFLFDSLVVWDARKEHESFHPESIKDKVEKVDTMSQGKCTAIKW